MTIRNLDHAFQPRSVAIIGASGRPGAVGKVVLDNVLAGGFAGAVWPVNPKYAELGGKRCYHAVADLPEAPDLAVIMTPPQSVPGLIAELGAKGTRAAVVLTAGLTAESGLRQQMLDAAKPYLLRIIGPNTIGLSLPPLGLNAGFAHLPARAGRLALISQSGAIATTLIDWAADKELGFSHIISLGDMADVDVGDCLDMLANDPGTNAILMYLETVSNPLKFMSAARAASRLKPVIAVKSGRHEKAAKAAATHTGALAGADRVVDAALRRAGILRVTELAELFDAAEVMARFHPLASGRLGIVTNGGGAGVLAVDKLMDEEGDLADLSPETLDALNAFLPETWSHANPVDIIGDAPPERYRRAIATVAADPGVDALMVINCPTALGSPAAAAEVVGELVTAGSVNGKPVLACWLGDHAARPARHVLQKAGVASFDTPGEAIQALSFLTGWGQRQQALMRVPARRGEDVITDRHAAEAIFVKVAAEGRAVLTEDEAKQVLKAYGIRITETLVAETPEAVAAAAETLLPDAGAVVVKLLSKTISHKSDVGGVVLNIGNGADAAKAARDIIARVEKARPGARIDGFTIQPMISLSGSHELIIGVDEDPIFGPVILFGAGGTSVEVLADTAIGLPPFDDVLGADIISRTRISRLLAGYRDRPAADRQSILHALNAVSQLVVDFPCLKALDINPLLASANGSIALDARIEIDPARIDEPAPNPRLALRPYPGEWTRGILVEGNQHFVLRAIKPSDVALYPAFFEKVTAEDIRLRFNQPQRRVPQDMLLRFTQIDYDREMAFVAIDPETGALGGVARLAADPDRDKAEYGILVRSDLQGIGLGWALLSHLLKYARTAGIGEVFGTISAQNRKMLEMCERLGFAVSHDPNEPGGSIARIFPAEAAIAIED